MAETASLPLLLRVEPRLASASPEVPPPWLGADLWAFHRLPMQLPAANGIDRLDLLAMAAEDFRRASIFLRNRGESAVQLDVMPPGPAWKLTGLGEFPEGEAGANAAPRRASPLLPQDLPRAFVVQPRRIVLVQIADLGQRPARPLPGRMGASEPCLIGGRDRLTAPSALRPEDGPGPPACGPA